MPFSRTLPVRSPGWFSGSSSEAAKRAASSSTGPASSAASPLSPPTVSRTRRISASGAAYGIAALLQARQHSRSPPAAAPRYAGGMASVTIGLGAAEARSSLALGGEGPNGAADAPRIVPALFHEARKGRYEISIETPQMLTPRGSAATAFERAAHAIAFGKNAVKEYREMERPMAKGAENYYEATYDVSYADPKLISLVFTIATFSGGAHPNSARIALLFDLAAGRALKLADVLADPKTAVAEIAARCKTQLEEQAKKEDWELFDNADVAAVVGEDTNWAADKEGVEILFDPYSVAPYVVGPRECRLSYADVKEWLNPSGPLPPR